MRRLGTVSTNLEARNREGEFFAIARLAIQNQGFGENVAKNAQAKRHTARVVSIIKSPVVAGGIDDPNWGSELADYRTLETAFLESPRNTSVFDRMRHDGMRTAPMRSRVSVVTLAGAGTVVGQYHVKPVTHLELTSVETEPLKGVAIIVVSDEVWNFSKPAAVRLFNEELRSAVIAATDATFLAGLLVGVSPSATAGTSPAAVLTDLRTMLAALTIGAQSRLYYVTTPSIAKNIATMTGSDGGLAFPKFGVTGGEIVTGVTALVSDQLADDTVMLVVADGLIGDSESISLNASSQTTLEMENAPTSPLSANAVLTNMWAQGMRALKAERYFSFKVARAGSIAAVSGVTYSNNNSPA